MPKTIKIIRIILILVSFGLLVFLVNKNFALNGKLRIEKDFSKYSFLIDDFLPKSRVNEIKNESGKHFQEIKLEPVYFQLNLPAYFSKADIKIEYQNKKQEIIEIGVEKAEGIFEFKPLENKILDNLTWSVLTDGQVTFWQKNKKYQTISDFLNNLPAKESIAKYRYDLKIQFNPKNYKKLKTKKNYNIPLKDNLRLFTYIENEPLAMDFYFNLPKITSQNNYFGQIRLKDYFNNKVVYENKLFYKDLEELVDNNFIKYSFIQNNLNNGVYELQLMLAPDKQINKLNSAQKLMIFKNYIHIAEDKKQLNKFYSDSLEYKISSEDLGSLPVLEVAEQVLEVTDIYKQYRLLKPTTGLKLIKLNAKEMELYYDENISLTKESYFDPFIKELKPYWQLSTMPIEYIIANYQPQNKYNDYLWQTRNVEFDLSNAFYKVKDGYKTLKFIISAPGLTDNNLIKIRNIKINLTKDPISFKKIKNKLLQ